MGKTIKLKNSILLDMNSLNGKIDKQLEINGRDFVLGTSGTSSDDSGDIVFTYGDKSEKARIWTTNNLVSSTKRPQYRSFDSNGNMLTQSELALTDDTFNFMRIIGCNKQITIPSGDSSQVLFAPPTISGYTLAGIMTYNQGYGDQWLISYGIYGGNIVAETRSKYPADLTNYIQVRLLYLRNDYYNVMVEVREFN